MSSKGNIHTVEPLSFSFLISGVGERLLEDLGDTSQKFLDKYAGSSMQESENARYLDLVAVPDFFFF